ncbi:conserved hypothetical protein [Ricinus communis]|uniref:Uncharacterized protein n=1 Tax=Ricinus communis TaxID=3988 RepID=B9SCT5_RICCO|nr:conserved hypothetical protein [Ricinus communis]
MRYKNPRDFQGNKESIEKDERKKERVPTKRNPRNGPARPIYLYKPFCHKP